VLIEFNEENRRIPQKYWKNSGERKMARWEKALVWSQPLIFSTSA
jgi:hypothetical protein